MRGTKVYEGLIWLVLMWLFSLFGFEIIHLFARWTEEDTQ